MSHVPTEPSPAPEVTLDEFAAAHASGAYVLDVRQPDEYENAHVPGAALIPLDELGARWGEIPDAGTVWVICALGGRSMKAATALRSAGLDAVSVGGGTNGWIERGHATVSGPNP
ncbi:MAG TPA: rhodanese-like domain-containing protein [Acidimicrobiales bacterium]|nr:rhodanese-like domain-containing protein [Acidimicrobiales bacterium]